MRDYSEKRGGREIDRNKPVAKNRPRKESGGLFTFLALLVLVLVYGAGVLTGWFVFKGKQPPAVAAVQPAKKPEAAPPEPPKADAPFTFYKTLPQGGKGVIGTGLNLKTPEAPHGAPSTLPTAVPAAPPASEPGAGANQAPAAPAPGSAAAPGADAAAAKAENPAHFVVQVASYKEKQEAVAAQAKLAAKGLPAYLVESRVPDKGVWYRLRVGRHLTRSEAEGMAAKSGKGAIVLAE